MRRLSSNNQQGFVSIIVTMIIMAVLSLIVLGFAQLARREQRQALDRQLSTQAYYAAESGINDARAYLAAHPDFSNQQCSTTIPAVSSNVSASGVVAYSCLLINSALPDLRYQDVSTNTPTIVPINTSAALTDLTIEWEQKDKPTQSLYTGTKFPAAGIGAGKWGDNVGVLRVDLVPATPPLDRDTMRNNTFTAFLYPSSGGSNTLPRVTAPNQQGQIVPVKCSTSATKKYCWTTITNLGGQKYFLQLKSIYTASDVQIEGTMGFGGSQAIFTGAQSEVDSTGRANDVLKRLKVRIVDPSSEGPIPKGSIVYPPDYALDSGSGICKQLSVSPTAGSSSNTCP